MTGKLATFAPRARVIHIDIDPANIGKNRAPELSLTADACEALRALHNEVKARGAKELEQSLAGRAIWWKRVRGWQRALYGKGRSPS